MASFAATPRLAGILQLASVVAVGIPLLYATHGLMVVGNPAATVANLLASETTFRLCIVSELAGTILVLLAAWLLSRIFQGFDEGSASLLILLAASAVPISFASSLANIAALEVLHSPGILAAFAQPGRDALAVFCLDLHTDGISLTNVFWGLWLFPFGMLVLRSHAMPRILGAWLLLNCVGVLSVSLITLLAPAYAERAFQLDVIPQFGQIAALLWLVVKGVNLPPDQRLS